MILYYFFGNYPRPRRPPPREPPPLYPELLPEEGRE